MDNLRRIIFTKEDLDHMKGWKTWNSLLPGDIIYAIANLQNPSRFESYQYSSNSNEYNIQAFPDMWIQNETEYDNTIVENFRFQIVWDGNNILMYDPNNKIYDGRYYNYGFCICKMYGETTNHSNKITFGRSYQHNVSFIDGLFFDGNLDSLYYPTYEVFPITNLANRMNYSNRMGAYVQFSDNNTYLAWGILYMKVTDVVSEASLLPDYPVYALTENPYNN